MRTPSSTYRLQFHKDFRFEDARKLVDYFDKLGITDLYSSPIFQARPGSTHGYDVVDPTSVNQELGGRAELNLLAGELRSRGMGLLLDIVPNHMAVSLDNPWWYDILENGRRSPYADYFDIDWNPASGIAENKVILPILRTVYAEALEGQRLRLFLDDKGIAIRYYGLRLPLELATTRQILTHRLESFEDREAKAAIVDISAAINEWSKTQSELSQSNVPVDDASEDLPHNTMPVVDPEETRQTGQVIRTMLWEVYSNNPEARAFLDHNIALFNGRKGEPESFNLLDALLNSQWYRLSFWRTALDNINYRRFFNISDLISLRTEQPEVFDSTHRLVFELLREGHLSGLRIDHIDGLRDPHEYLDRLQSVWRRMAREADQAETDLYIVIEKILSGEEDLPDALGACGTTGYDYLNVLNRLFLEPEGLTRLERFYSEFTGLSSSFQDVEYEKKKLVIGRKFYSEFMALKDQFDRIANRDRYGRDLSRRELEKTLLEATACLPVYRTYVRSFSVSEQDKQVLDRTFAMVRARNPLLSAAAQRFLKRVLTLDFTSAATEDDKHRWLAFVMRWQQFTGPVAAKGVEDSALYSYNCLISLNEVGSDPAAGSVSPTEFHRYNQKRLERWPSSMNATSTHDTKRGEDARARLNVLSEMSESWTRKVGQWSRWNRKFRREIDGKTLPDDNQEIMLYQTLVSSWPLLEKEMPEWKDRLEGYVEKAMREAQAYSNWRRPNEANESAVKEFMMRILTKSRSNHFLSDFLDFEREVAFFGALNGLSQVLLKIVSPGVPDFFQGTEMWNLAMVDPDNRRPIDFRTRIMHLERILAAGEGIRDLAAEYLADWKSGAIKLLVTSRFLNFRRENRDLFEAGSYAGAETSGQRREFLCAILRSHAEKWVLAAVPRLVTNLVHHGQFPTGQDVWQDTVIMLPSEAPANWRNILTGEQVSARSAGPNQVLDASAVFETLPVAALSA
ncbi:MAG TPA: malto-oligosyltrehalose synthase [Acidobacteriota bacterium]|nr:malto-oligosyltrehalose synthase [Acidobacteriota bacterium]